MKSTESMTDFDRIIDRRELLKGSLALGAGAFVATAIPGARVLAHPTIRFNPVAANGHDTVTLPEGFEWRVVAAWGDPLWSGEPGFDHATRGTAASQARAFGDNCDGMAFFQVNGRYLLAVNNEYCNRNIIYGNRASGLPENDDDVHKGMAAHGVSIFEVARRDGQWRIVLDSPYNRRITAATPAEITGPARGHDLLKTTADPTGTRSLGTWNNCGNGVTPWGTFLTCEENFNGYFAAPGQPEAELSDALKRYGVKTKDRGYDWSRVDDRFDVARNPNEPNRAGYIVEIDPSAPRSAPKKRTAMGRFKHENCEVVVAESGHVVVYMGDDERGEFIYRFVSSGRFVPGAEGNGDLLEDGVLSVAKFEEDGSGRWIELTPEATGMAREEICVLSRVAGSRVGATTMDRPEWVAANPHKAEVYCCLTNNKNRGIKPNAGGDPTPVGGPNPREANRYGQIVRWVPAGGDHTAEGFSWDLFVIAGNPGVHDDARAGSANINVENMFNSPDGLAFDSLGNLWIQTDGNYSNEGDFAGMGNNQMLMADVETGEIRRFLVGPRECEITGITWSTDRRTMFVGIQHPGEDNPSACHFPDGGSSVPRSAVIAVTRTDGGYVG